MVEDLGGAARPGLHGANAPAQPARLKDPVCGITVTPKSFHSLPHEGRVVYFCSASCKARFAAKPARFAPAMAPAAPPDGAVSTCPIQPEATEPPRGPPTAA
jgi:P-type Cu+ transporter